MTDVLPSWKAGPTRDQLVGFLDQVADVAPEDRVAVLDNDGTLWCEKPQYTQFDFMIGALQEAVATNPSVAEREEFAALLGGDQAAIAEVGLVRLVHALAELFAGTSPEAFAERARRFVMTAEHRALGRPYATTIYQPMLELLDELRRRGFVVFIVTGGGTEFVRAVSRELYDVTPDRVVGTLVRYELTRTDGAPNLLRTADLDGGANEGATKVENIQRHLGRRPIFAAGNSPGDTEMLEYAAAAPGPSLALIVEHDDDTREYAYESVGATVDTSEAFSETARTAGWTVVSMRDDWSTVFPERR